MERNNRAIILFQQKLNRTASNCATERVNFEFRTENNSIERKVFIICIVQTDLNILKFSIKRNHEQFPMNSTIVIITFSHTNCFPSFYRAGEGVTLNVSGDEFIKMSKLIIII